MNEQLRKYSKAYSETDLEVLLCDTCDLTRKTASNIAIYEQKENPESAHKKIDNADILSAVLAAALEEGFIAEIEGNKLIVAQSEKFEQKFTNRFWVADHVGSELVKQAAKGDIKIERIPSKYSKPAEELGWGTPGYTYCSVWRIPATHTIEINGYVIPAYMVGYTQKVLPRQTQWGTKETENKQKVPEKAKVSKLQSVNRIIESHYIKGEINKDFPIDGYTMRMPDGNFGVVYGVAHVNALEGYTGDTNVPNGTQDVIEVGDLIIEIDHIDILDKDENVIKTLDNIPAGDLEKHFAEEEITEFKNYVDSIISFEKEEINV
jgi:hypothetical protein